MLRFVFASQPAVMGKASTSDELNQLTRTIAQRVTRYLEHQGAGMHASKNMHRVKTVFEL